MYSVGGRSGKIDSKIIGFSEHVRLQVSVEVTGPFIAASSALNSFHLQK